MSLNKHAVIRYRAIDECLSNYHRKWNIQDIHDAVNDALYDYNGTEGIEIRQLRADIAFMKDEKGHAAPIEFYRDGNKYLYRYSEKDFSISNNGINSGEAETMGEAVRFLSSFRGRPGFEMLDEIIPVLEDKLKIKDLDKNFISYSDNTKYKGYTLIGPLFKAIKDKIVLNVEYQPYDEKSFMVKFHPHYLKNYNNRYFVFGLNEDMNMETWNMPLDRINEISQLKDKTFIKTNVDWENHFKNIVGVTRKGGTIEKIRLKFTKNRLNYILTKPIHQSQDVISKEPEFGIVEINVEINNELRQMLYSFGGDVEVLEPASLKKEMKKEAEKMLHLYR